VYVQENSLLKLSKNPPINKSFNQSFSEVVDAMENKREKIDKSSDGSVSPATSANVDDAAVFLAFAG